MKKNVLKRTHKGAIIEMAIAFFFVVLALTMLILSTVSMSNARNKKADFSLVRQSSLSQIGEYYLRAVEDGGDFPTNCADATHAKYSWIDPEAEAFFADCGEKYGYTFESSVFVDTEGLFSWFQTKASYRKLYVKQNGTTVMTILVRESKGSMAEDLMRNKVSPIYEVLDWSVNDVATIEKNVFQSTNTSAGRQLLTTIFRLIGEIVSSIFR